MVGRGLSGGGRPVRARRGLRREREARLAALGRRLPPPSGETARVIAAERAAWRRRRLALGLVVAVLAAALVGGAVQWFRPLAQPVLEGLPTRLDVPGTAPGFPWPAKGEAALSVPGLGTLEKDRSAPPAPVGPLSGVLVAHMILKDHPLPTGGQTGPTIAVTPQTLAAYQTGSAAGEPEVPVAPGESLTELDALEGLLVDSGNDMATLLADWDAGSTSAFVTRMDLDALSLGLRNTRVTQPGGSDDAVLSTPDDLVRLAEAAMQIPVFRQIVSIDEVVLPGAGLRYNPNFLLGRKGMVGVEAGADTTADGCYLFAAQEPVGGQPVTIYGAVLGQSGPSGPDTAAVDAGGALVTAAGSELTAVPVLQAGRVVGRLAAPWGASAPVVASEPVTVVAWPGLGIPVTARPAALSAPVAAGTWVGTLAVRQGRRVIQVVLRSTAPLPGPTRFWRLTR